MQQETHSLALTGTLRTIPREINVGYVIAIPKFTSMLKARRGSKSNTIVSTVTWFLNTVLHYLCFPPKSRPATPQRKAQGMSSGEPMCSTCVKYKITGTKLMNTKLALPTMLRKSAASPNLALPRTILKSTWGVNKEKVHLWWYKISLCPPAAQKQHGRWCLSITLKCDKLTQQGSNEHTPNLSALTLFMVT